MPRRESQTNELAEWITETSDEDLRRGEAIRGAVFQALADLWRIYAELHAEIAPLLAAPPHRDLADPEEARQLRPGERLEVDSIYSCTDWPTHLARSLWGLLEEELAGTLQGFPEWIPSHGTWRAEIHQALRRMPDEAREAMLAAKRQLEANKRSPGSGDER